MGINSHSDFENFIMRLFSLILPAVVLSQDYDDYERGKGNKDKGKGKGPKGKDFDLETFSCEGTAIEDAISSATNVEVFGCMDFETGEVEGEDGEDMESAQFMNKKPEGALGQCLFKCADDSAEARSEAQFAAMNEERKKKGKKPKKDKGKKDKKKKKKDKKDKKTKWMKVSGLCTTGEGWSFITGKKNNAAEVADLICE